jgi:mannuronan synthase
VTTGEVLRATATGQIVFLDLAAARGDVAVAIQAASGDVQSLVMPCDCAVTANDLREGSTVLLGEPVAWLHSADDRTG